MNYIVFDLEWNMASPQDIVDPVKRKEMPYEIVQIGAVKLDNEANEIRRFDVRIKPVLYKKLNRHVGYVTNMCQILLDTGYPFKQAIKGFLDFCGEDYCLCSWSDSDIEPLKSNLRFHGYSDKLNVRILDVQAVFTEIMEKGSGQRSVEYALDLLQIEKQEDFHIAINDAVYTAKVLRELILEAKKIGENDFVKRFSYDPDIKRKDRLRLSAQDTEQEIVDNIKASELFCPACGKKLKFISNWTQKSNRRYIAELCCEEHGSVDGQARVQEIRTKKWRSDILLKVRKIDC